MKKIIIFILILCFTSILLYCSEKAIDEKDLIMPKNLTFYSLPDDYDKRIEPFFTYYYQFLKAQDVKADLGVNMRKSKEFIDKLSTDEFKMIWSAIWLLRNKYPEYFAEFTLLNLPMILEPQNESKFMDKSITSYLFKRYDTKCNYNSINSFNVSLTAAANYQHNIISLPLSDVYIVGKVKSIVPAYRRDKIVGYNLMIDVLYSFGGNYFPLDSIVAKFIGSKQALDSMDLNSEYVMVIYPEYDDIDDKINKEIFIYSVALNEMKKIENNMITRSDSISYNEFLKKIDTNFRSQDGDLSYFFTNDEQQLSLTKFDEILEKYKNFEFRSNQ